MISRVRAERRVVGHAVEALDHLGPGCAEAQDETPPRELVDADRRHGQERRSARVERQDARADLRLLRHRGQEPHGGDRIGGVSLAGPEVLDADVLQPLGVGGERVGVVAHPHHRAQLHRRLLRGMCARPVPARTLSAFGAPCPSTIEGTIYPCRLRSPKTTAPWARPPRTSSPSTIPAGPPGPCSRPTPNRRLRSGMTWPRSAGSASTSPRTRVAPASACPSSSWSPRSSAAPWHPAPSCPR